MELHKSRIYKFDNCRLFLMFLVIIGHAIAPIRGVSRYVDFVWPLLRGFAMPLFIIISGCLYRERKLSYCVKKFLYPCILFTVILWFWGWIFYPPWKESIPFLEPAHAMWYLWCLAIYYCITPFLLKMVKQKSAVLLVIAFALSWICGFIPYIGSTLQASRLVCFYPFFLIGVILKDSDSCFKQWFRQPNVRYRLCAWGGC